jgi:hypothetical protein
MTGSHLQVRLAPVKCRECLVWESETRDGPKDLTVQMNPALLFPGQDRTTVPDVYPGEGSTNKR